MKDRLRRTLGQATLNSEEMSILLCRIEAILNYKPLDDIRYTSWKTLNRLPETDAVHRNGSTLSKWSLGANIKF